MHQASRDTRPLVVALAALAIAAAAARLVTTTPNPLGLTGGAGLTWLGYAVVWVPLLAGSAVIATRLLRGVRAGSDGPIRLWGLRFHPLDLFWGFAAGCLARAFDAFVNGSVYGDTGLHPSLVLGGPPSTASLVVAILAPVVIAPVIEELFFRGILMHALGEAVGTRLSARLFIVVVTAILFALLHVVAGSTGVTAGEVTFVGTLVFGLVAGALTMATGRIGSALVAHVVFNGVAVLLTWP